jgi:putative tricarboxylic transport membrane protein
MQEKTYKSADLWSGLAFAALGAYIIATAWQWEYLGADGPGPGFFPLWYGIAMLALSLCLVAASALRKPEPGTAAAINWRESGRALSVWLALVAAIAVSS